MIKLKSYISEVLKLFGLYKPARGLYNFLSLYSSKMKVKVLNLEATFITPTYKIRDDLSLLLGERQFLEAFLSEIKTDDIIWDVGASYGLYTILSALNTPKGTVYAFEPESSTYKMLIKNIRLNNLQNIKPLQFALAEKTGESLFFTSKSPNIGTHSMIKRTDYPVSKKGKLIKTFSGDELVEQNILELPNLIKIDVEGAELNVLYGLRKILSSERLRIIQIEIHPKILYLCDQNENSVLKFIESYNFNLIKSEKRGNEIEIFYKRKN